MKKTIPEVTALLLAAGLGERLKPLTDIWPKCLMPIGGRPLLEHWLQTLNESGIYRVLVNLHHHAPTVRKFLERPRFNGMVTSFYESELLGTAGTLKANKTFFQKKTTLLVHADNWCQCDFVDFLDFHINRRPDHCPITMMTFDSSTPQACGIVETNAEGVVLSFLEKSTNPAGTCANAAVYLLEPDVIDWIQERPRITDFSTEVIPNFIGHVATWQNKNIHRDIGVLNMLKLAQLDPIPPQLWPNEDPWQKNFKRHPIHKQILESKV